MSIYDPHLSDISRSLPAWGVWIEIVWSDKQFDEVASHSPHGECGLKSRCMYALLSELVSLPAWGVWIEIMDPVRHSYNLDGHSPHGECGLKYRGHQGRNGENRHSPHGECGLKSLLVAAPLYPAVVTPRMGSVD